MSTTMTPTTRTHPTRRPPAWSTQLMAETLDEIKLVYREPAALFFSVLLPVMFFGLFSSLFGGEEAAGGTPVGTTMLATFGAYGVIGAVMLTPGIGLAEARDRGWLQVVKVSPVPVPISLAARVIAVAPYCVAILAAMTATAAALGVLTIAPARWLLLVAALVLGALPFALVGLTVGARASANATTAILNAMVIPLAIAGGLWFPLEMLPGWVADLAPALPTHHLAGLGLAAIEGGPWLGHVAYLVGFTLVAGVVATVVYRRSPS